MYLLGLAYVRSNQPAKARQVFQELFAEGANPAQANFLVGKAYYEGGNFEQAERAFRLAIDDRAVGPAARIELAKVLISERKNEEAEAQLRSVLKSDASNSDALYLLGALLVQENRYGAGADILNRHARRIPTHGPSRSTSASAH